MSLVIGPDSSPEGVSDTKLDLEVGAGRLSSVGKEHLGVDKGWESRLGRRGWDTGVGRNASAR